MSAVLDGRSTAPGDKHLARALALTMHAVFAALLVFGVSWQKKPPEPVTADLWATLPPMPQPRVAAPVEPEEEPEPPKPVPRVKPVAKPEPRAEPKAIPKADIATKQEKKAEPKKREEDKAALERKAAEVREREQQAKKQLEAEKEAEAKLAVEKAAAAEKAAADRAARAAAAREVQKYVNGIQSKVWARVALPPDLQGNPEAVFEVSLFPGGELANVTMRKSSGNPAYDAAIANAIRQAQPFVVPTGDLFHGHFRPVIMAFRPR